MINRLTMVLVCAAGCLAQAQEADLFSLRRLSVGGTLVSTQGDYRATTRKSNAYGLEVAYNATESKPVVNTRVYLGVIRNPGKTVEENGVSFKHSLHDFRAGADLVFNTWGEGLKLYLGVNMNWWDGKVEATAPGYSETVNDPERKAKFGYRLGVEYRLDASMAVSMDYNQSEYIHDLGISPLRVKGVNPLNPSWVGVSFRYTFAR